MLNNVKHLQETKRRVEIRTGKQAWSSGADRQTLSEGEPHEKSRRKSRGGAGQIIDIIGSRQWIPPSVLSQKSVTSQQMLQNHGFLRRCVQKTYETIT